MTLTELFFESIKDDLKAVENNLQGIVGESSSILNKSSSGLLNAGGKRLRPGLTLLAGKLFHYDLPKLLSVASAVELTHMTTLVHDDVIDNSLLRRGQDTINYKWGNKIAVLAGDLLYVNAIRALNQLQCEQSLEKLLRASLAMCKGEASELISTGLPYRSEENYIQTIRDKTAVLIATCCQLGGKTCGATEREEEILYNFGLSLGIAFQIMDDLKDIVESSETMGKFPQDDLREGTITLPVIFALELSSQKAKIESVLKMDQPNEQHLAEAVEAIVSSPAIEKTVKKARQYGEEALDHLAKLPSQESRTELQNIVQYICGYEIKGETYLSSRYQSRLTV